MPTTCVICGLTNTGLTAPERCPGCSGHNTYL